MHATTPEDPLAWLLRDRSEAFAASDPMASLCTAATIDSVGQPRARTLVLRELAGRLAVFINATSPKWRELQATPAIAITTYFPSIQVQYRLQCNVEAISAELISEHWPLRPEMPRRLDWVYHEQLPQSSTATDRATILKLAQAVDMRAKQTPPPEALGVYLHPHQIERLALGQPDGLHDRVLFTRTAQGWQRAQLVP